MTSNGERGEVSEQDNGALNPGKPWRRLWARCIDGMLANIVLIPVWVPAVFALTRQFLPKLQAKDAAAPTPSFFAAILIFVLAFRGISTVLAAAYVPGRDHLERHRSAV